MTAEDVIATLGLLPHPEGGHYREVYRHDAAGGRRGDMTSIYYLLRASEESRWHRVRDAVELWSFHAGEALELRLASDGSVEHCVLGTDLDAGQRPQVIVPQNCWQAARPLGAWTLVGCVVAPAFEFSGFDMAPPGWEPDS